MPYISSDDRVDIDEIIDELVETLTDQNNYMTKEGMANYVISRIISEGLKPNNGWNYKSLLIAYGTFLSAGAEFYRRLVIPYEKKKVKENGDIEGYRKK